MVAASRLPLGSPSFNSFIASFIPYPIYDFRFNPKSAIQNPKLVVPLIPLTFLVALPGIKQSLSGDLPASFSPLGEEAASVTHVTGPAAKLLYLKEQRVIVSVDEGILDLMVVAGFLAFEPEPPPRAAVVVGLAGLRGLFPGLGIHVGEHQHLA